MGGLSLLSARARTGLRAHGEPQKNLNDAAIDLLDDEFVRSYGFQEPGWLHVVPYSQGRESYVLKLWGWSLIEDRKLHVPHLLIEAAITLGVKGDQVDKGVRFASDIRVNYRGVPADYAAVFCREDSPSWLRVHAGGFRYIEFESSNPSFVFWKPTT